MRSPIDTGFSKSQTHPPHKGELVFVTNTTNLSCELLYILENLDKSSLKSMIDFIGDTNGQWLVTHMQTVVGKSIESVSHLRILEENSQTRSIAGIWTLRGLTSNVRYTEKAEREKLTSIQESLGRLQSTCAALIPIRKSEEWWALAQDERRAIFENKSHHIETGLKYLPAIARKLYHGRDIGEPFDFLTWFEYAPKDAEAFEELVTALRKTEEWSYVDREVDIRLARV